MFLMTFSHRFISGVADGVGGWRNYGIDAGEFSNFLMRTCERLVQSTTFNPHQPVDLLAGSYYELLEQKKPILGESRDSKNELKWKFFHVCEPVIAAAANCLHFAATSTRR